MVDAPPTLSALVNGETEILTFGATENRTVVVPQVLLSPLTVRNGTNGDPLARPNITPLELLHTLSY